MSSTRLTLVLTDEELAAFAERASAEGLSTAAWLERTATREAWQVVHRRDWARAAHPQRTGRARRFVNLTFPEAAFAAILKVASTILLWREDAPERVDVGWFVRCAAMRALQPVEAAPKATL